MKYKTYRVTCLSCKGHDDLKVTNDNKVFYTNHTPIISARFRPDMNWGFECMCGNDSRLAIEEKNQLKTLVRGSEHSIKRLARTLTRGNELKFKMETI